MTSSVPLADPGRARAVLGEARLLRSRYLIAVTEGTLAPLDVVEAATRPENKALRRISLRQLLLAQPRVGEARTRDFLAGVTARLGQTEPITHQTIAWLIDPRSGGRRLWAWLDTAHPKGPPWPGYPLAPCPVSSTTTSCVKVEVDG